MGESDYEQFKIKLLEAAPEFDCNGVHCYSIHNTCDHYIDRLENLTIKLENTLYTLTPSGYTFSGDNAWDFKCTVAISFLDDNGGIYILGDTFLRNFVSTFNFAEGRIDTGVNIYASEGTSIETDYGIFNDASDMIEDGVGVAIDGSILALVAFMIALVVLTIAAKWYCEAE